ncbi:hypothetical protein BDP27DRAFT_1363860 [Rhodocollybia butyracea]|uniref:Uncharacterized protein n=1 Tax=Rhodocollybia butyracea TaxID=206335 RepID=A0A9P5PMT4_9AGAR|nr:hypothetical protein BDP27DRAFT_1363860 [Rhodocollybia butyracea]
MQPRTLAVILTVLDSNTACLVVILLSFLPAVGLELLVKRIPNGSLDFSTELVQHQGQLLPAYVSYLRHLLREVFVLSSTTYFTVHKFIPTLTDPVDISRVPDGANVPSSTQQLQRKHLTS